MLRARVGAGVHGAAPHLGGVGVGPAQVQAAVGGGRHIGVVIDESRERAGERGVVVDGHLVVRRAAPAARVLEPAGQRARWWGLLSAFA